MERRISLLLKATTSLPILVNPWHHCDKDKNPPKKAARERLSKDGIMERRVDRIEVAVNDVCAKHQALCDGIEKKVYVE
jgi:hypothetical protein